MAAKATGDTIIFADRTVRPLEPDWLDELAGPLQIAGVGLVGAKLLEEKTMRIRHAGLVFNDAGEPEYIFRGDPEHVFAEFGAANWCRNWCAVSGACFAVRRSTWESLGGLAETPTHPRLDIDLCLRVQLEAKLRVMYNPAARLTQSATANIELWPNPDKRGQYIRSSFPSGDPYLNPNIVVRDGAPSLRRRDTHEPKATDYAADSRVFVSAFDFDSATVARSRQSTAGPATHQVGSLTWLIPEFTNPWYGGINTILRFADYFGHAHGVASNFAVLGECHHSVIRRRIGNAFPELGEKSQVTVLRSLDAIPSLPPCDGILSTLWTTAFAALRFERARRKFYFVQDYEPFFYPAGSASALVESTYDFGYYGICNTIGLRDLYVARGGEADYFDPSINTQVFYSTGRRISRGKPWTVFCYMRPGHARNGFELIAAALRIVKQQLGEDVRILTAGADWNPAAYGLEGILHNLGDVGYAASGALYRTCDAGVVMMMTCHPSYLPFELMASGALVITNRNQHTQWLLQDRENCLLSEGSAGSLAETIVEGLKDGELRGKITQAASELIAARYSNWDAQAEKVYQCLIRQS
jgi:glycosyltransferase involved in cell wall biosynthesis